MKRLLLPLILAAIIALSGCGSAAAAPQPLRSVPWEDGEELIYDVYHRGEIVGEVSYSFGITDINIELLDDDEYQYQNIISRHTEKDIDEVLENMLLLNPNTLQTAASFCQYSGNESQWVVTTIYENDYMLVASFNYEDEKKTADKAESFKLPETYPHDDGNSETLPQFLRLFPKPAEPYTLCLGQPGNFNKSGPMYQICRVSYYKTREMIWNGQPVRAYGIRVGPAGSMRQPSTTYWYSDDETRTLLQTDQGQVSYVLQGVDWIFR